ncbi:YdcF family protein [Amycolatopsis sp., V23-08]|uniref:YdcF family protein n=1 Tax=Amycolatopsis heterodermiae TaxID=3110235 RepID=A0ABU5QWH6_9PSEU|nr:YdcF family protein [Amycolatopsis sp., V23-08]MEA5358275.1 YdcF family protein [Amycolatopsis sp., V23-08]
MTRQLTDVEWHDAELVWDFHQVHHEISACDVAIALGCNDIGVAEYAAELYHRGMFQTVVFTGATSRDTAAIFPRGEAVHFRERALELGVPDTAILVEPQAANTGANITLSRDLLIGAGLTPDSVLLISMPYMERRAFATCRRLWPEVAVTCTSAPLTLEEYVKTIGDAAEVVDMMIGDLQRVMIYPKCGFAIEQPVPPAVAAAFDRLVAAGFNSRLL